MMKHNLIKSKVISKDNPQLDLVIAKEILKENPSADEQITILEENQIKTSEASYDTKRPKSK